MALNTRIDHYARNTIGRDLIVGDIHGQFAQLDEKLRAIGFDSARDRLFAVGDLIDRGLKSHEAIAFLDLPWFRSVRGNHEEALIGYFAFPHDPREQAGYARGFGAGWAFERPELARRLAVRFLELPLGIEIETEHGIVGILHADCPAPSWDELKRRLAKEADNPPFARPIANSCTWSRERAECQKHDIELPDVEGVRAVVVGHTPRRAITRWGNVIDIDTVQWFLPAYDSEWTHNWGELTILDAATLEPAQALGALASPL